MFSSSQLKRILQDHTNVVKCVAFDNTGRKLITASYDGKLCFYDVLTWSLLKVLTLSERFISAIAISPNNHYIVVGLRGGKVTIIELETQVILHCYDFLGIDVVDLKFSANGYSLFVALVNNTVQLITLATGFLEKSFACEEMPAAISISVDGQSLAVGCIDGNIRVWDISQKNVGFTSIFNAGLTAINSLTFSSDNQFLASTNYAIEAPIVKLWNIPERTERIFEHGSFHNVNAILFIPDNTVLITCSDNNIISLWSTVTFRLLHSIYMPGNNIAGLSLAFEPKQRLLAIGTDNNQCLVYQFIDEVFYYGACRLQSDI